METQTSANSNGRGALRACSFLTGIGWIILAAAVLLALTAAYEALMRQPQSPQAGYGIMISGRLAGMILMGLIALMLAQFIKYAFGVLDEPPMLVRHGDKILFLYAAVTALSGIGQVIYVLGVTGYAQSGLVVMAFLTVSKILILAGAGVVLGKVVPAVHEAKGIV